MRWGEVGPPYWSDAPVYIIGGGPSLYGVDFERFRGKGHILGVNQSMFDAPVEAGVSVDHDFIKRRRDQLVLFACQHPLYLAPGDTANLPPLPLGIYLHSDPRPGLSESPREVRRGSSSGYTALNVAVLKRARKIILCGYDYSAFDGHHHYHDEYPWHHVANEQSWPSWARRYPAAAKDCADRGIEVINASERSALTCFPRVPLEKVLA